MRKLFKIFITGFTQVMFVSMNTYFVSETQYLAIGMSSFMISWIWSYNVKKIALGTIRDRVAYCLGASAGAVIGVLIARMI
jgi:uncharacterized protein YebE (UPF0316 family)